jgi:hypothetical protein
MLCCTQARSLLLKAGKYRCSAQCSALHYNVTALHRHRHCTPLRLPLCHHFHCTGLHCSALQSNCFSLVLVSATNPSTGHYNGMKCHTDTGSEALHCTSHSQHCTALHCIGILLCDTVQCNAMQWKVKSSALTRCISRCVQCCL